ncbi:MAG: hypothetical protein COB90_00310 [Hyphomicrobiales bacterium]|nr:MAG: hypothetical protein COB90_00310 [Hyphomicrobiales bacterium]
MPNLGQQAEFNFKIGLIWKFVLRFGGSKIGKESQIEYYKRIFRQIAGRWANCHLLFGCVRQTIPANLRVTVFKA